MKLTPDQRARWAKTRTKGQPRVLVEQFLCWGVAVGMLGPTLRHLSREGVAGARSYWTGQGGLEHLIGAVVFGGVATYLFGVFMWNRMESAYDAERREPQVRDRES